jgi:hypothetical protein
LPDCRIERQQKKIEKYKANNHQLMTAGWKYKSKEILKKRGNIPTPLLLPPINPLCRSVPKMALINPIIPAKWKQSCNQQQLYSQQSSAQLGKKCARGGPPLTPQFSFRPDKHQHTTKEKILNLPK